MLHLNSTDWLNVERELCARSFKYFVKQAWPVLEPTANLRWGFALDATCEHLEYVEAGEIRRLLINVPPGCMKSLLCGVMFPAWLWGPKRRPSHRFLGTSHKLDLAIRDNLKCRRLIKSSWYQNLWPIEISSDQDQKMKFENSATGFREAMAFTSMTGARGDTVLLDDPLSVSDADSELELEAVERNFTEALPTRLNDQSKSAIVVIMQRLHERDPSGLILSRGLPYVHLMLPMRFEVERRCRTSIGFVDPRTEDGELLFPELFPEPAVAELELTMGGPESYSVAGQLQQRPTPRGGGLFKKEWFDGKIVDAAPKKTRWARGWDFAATKGKRSAFTAGAKVGTAELDGRKCIFTADMKRKKGTPAEVEKLLLATAKDDGKAVRGSIPKDPGQAGVAQADYFISKLIGYRYEATPETGSKITRAEPLAIQAEVGNVYLVNGPWIKDFLTEIESFPMGRFKDQIDACSRAFTLLMKHSSYTLDNVNDKPEDE